jgi:signal recognition particle subunit SEC65
VAEQAAYSDNPLVSRTFKLLLPKQKFKIMASVKELKKDIDMLMTLVLTDCFSVLEYNRKVDGETVMKIAADVVRIHRELRLRVKHPDGKDNPKLVRKYYSSLVNDALKEADNALERLSVEVKKVATEK